MSKPCAYLLPAARIGDETVIEVCAREPHNLRLADCKGCPYYYPKFIPFNPHKQQKS